MTNADDNVSKSPDFGLGLSNVSEFFQEEDRAPQATTPSPEIVCVDVSAHSFKEGRRVALSALVPDETATWEDEIRDDKGVVHRVTAVATLEVDDGSRNLTFDGIFAGYDRQYMIQYRIDGDPARELVSLHYLKDKWLPAFLAEGP